MKKTSVDKVRLILLACLGALLLTPGLAPGATLRVPGDYKTIQAAIDAASNGDIVTVADGVYRGEGNRNLSFAGKAITVRSDKGPCRSIIDCEGLGRAFSFETSEGPASVMDGFTVVNGRAARGGAVFIKESSPTIANCIFLRNQGRRMAGVDGYGGAIYCSDDVVVDNAYPWKERGPCEPTITNCIFSENTANYGGAIYCYSDGPFSTTAPRISHCTFTRNHSDFEGGGLYSWLSEPEVRNCIFWHNSAGTLHPEIRVVGGTPSVSYSLVEGGYLGKGNLQSDPIFVSERDFHVVAGSPGINHGINAGVLRDIEGTRRPLSGGFDMGAYEYSGPCWDADSDGHTNRICGGDDCDDSNANLYPGNSNPFCNCTGPRPPAAIEIPGDGVDNNCNGLVDELW